MKTLSDQMMLTEELEDFSVMTIDNLGNKIWKDQNRYEHREDGPAVEYPNGNKYWYQHGKLHRVDGPAYESIDGKKYWYFNNLLHREDGPAVEDFNGMKCWYLHHKSVSEAEVKALGKIK